MAISPIFAIAGTVLGAVGTGISYYGQQQAAKTQATYATLNAQAQQVQATMASRLATAQASMAAQQEQNQKAAGLVNANALRGEAESRSRASQINIARQMEDQARFQSMIRAQAGKKGTVAGGGSQLDILMNAAELQALENSESQYQTEIQRRQLFREAEGAQLGAEYSQIQSGISLMEGEARASGYRQQGVQAKIQGLAGVSAARGASMAALGGALSGFGQLGANAWEMGRMGAFRQNQTQA